MFGCTAEVMRPALCRIVAALLFASVSGCLAPPGAAQRATDAAREMNLAARFGRMDVAVSHTANGARAAFLERRADWGKTVRVLDVELSGMAMSDEKNALIYVDVAWARVDESTLRSTRIAQSWRDDDEAGGWRLVREQRVAGDVGLFGEHVDIVRPPQRDVQFATKTIR